MQSKDKELKAIVDPCERCGACLPVCPLYAVTGREIAVARGKNAVVRALLEEGIEADEAVSKALDFCLLCKACVTACPNKVKTDEAMELARQKVAEKVGNSFAHKATGTLMQSPALIKLASTAIDLTKAVKLDRLIGKIVPLGLPEQYQSVLAGPRALPSNPDYRASKPKEFKKVAYFKGCAMKLFFPEVAESTIKVLQRVSEVCVPESVCCGMPHIAHGMGDTADELAQTTIETFAGYDDIITDCGSCGGALKSYAKRFVHDEKWASLAEDFSRKVMGFTEYLAMVGYEPQIKQAVTVTYHDSCHLVRGQGIKNPPRVLLKKAADYREMPGADTCCGGAGTFNIDFPEASDKVLAEKVNNIKKTGAIVVATECPACMLQLARAAGKNGFKVAHISQVLSNS